MNDTVIAETDWQPVRYCVETDTMAIELRPWPGGADEDAMDDEMPVTISSSITPRTARRGCGRSGMPHSTPNIAAALTELQRPTTVAA